MDRRQFLTMIAAAPMLRIVQPPATFTAYASVEDFLPPPVDLPRLGSPIGICSPLGRSEVTKWFKSIEPTYRQAIGLDEWTTPDSRS